MKAIGDRMKKNYEDRCRYYLTRRVPVIIRVDGRAFHTLTRGFQKPFDTHLMGAMQQTAGTLLEEIQGAKLAYTQSDEISILVTDWDTLQTEAWFDYNLSKVVSISAAIASTTFCVQLNRGLAQFDSRAFNIPREEVTNYFLWRALDWNRNSITMYAQSVFSHKELHGKGRADMHEMLHEVGKNWTDDLTPAEKNGTFVYQDDRLKRWKHNVQPRYEEINDLVRKVMPE